MICFRGVQDRWRLKILHGTDRAFDHHVTNVTLVAMAAAHVVRFVCFADDDLVAI